jgi:hypothetical protein
LGIGAQDFGDLQETRRQAEMAIFEYINGFAGGTQHWAGKAPSLLNETQPKRATRATPKRGRSKLYMTTDAIGYITPTDAQKVFYANMSALDKVGCEELNGL